MKIVRADGVKEWGNSQCPSQFGGGLNSGSVPITSLAVRRQANIALSKGAAAILFFDLSSAFAKAITSFAFPHEASHEIWKQRLISAGFCEDEVTHILDDNEEQFKAAFSKCNRHFLAVPQPARLAPPVL